MRLNQDRALVSGVIREALMALHNVIALHNAFKNVYRKAYDTKYIRYLIYFSCLRWNIRKHITQIKISKK